MSLQSNNHSPAQFFDEATYTEKVKSEAMYTEKVKNSEMGTCEDCAIEISDDSGSLIPSHSSSGSDTSTEWFVPDGYVPIMPAQDDGFVLRGPKNKGTDEWDKQCMFGNNILVCPRQIEFLKEWCNDRRPKIRYYVYRMTESAVIEKKCKMEFNAEFTTKYLKGFLDEPITVQVESMAEDDRVEVRMKMSVNNRAMITSGWWSAVQALNMRKDDAMLFSFWFNSEGKLRLMLAALL